MDFSVTKLSQGLITPCKPTPSDTLALSVIDRVPAVRSLVGSLHVFAHGQEPAKVIKEALSKALCLYYPFAGRLVELDQGEVLVACTGEGVWFVEASANCSLQDVNYMEHPLLIPEDKLLPDPHPERDPLELILLMQVTQFICGGFVVGILLDHAVTDGLGAGQFVNTVAELARGLHQPTVEPIWSREAIPNPPKLPPGPPQVFFTYRPEYFIMHVSVDRLNNFKNQFFEQMSQKCSTFDVSIAWVWQCRTQAIDFDPNIDVHLYFMANARQLLGNVLPTRGFYYGNCFYPVKVTAHSKKIAQGSIIEVVNLIREAKAKLPSEFAKWKEGELDEDPYNYKFNYETLFAWNWTHFGFNDVDYGWGKPARIFPFGQSDFMPLCILGLPPVEKGSGRFMTQCVAKADLEAFQEQMMKLA